MTTTRTPAGRSAGGGTEPGHGNGGNGGRIVRALTWARAGDPARASQLGAPRMHRGTAAGR